MQDKETMINFITFASKNLVENLNFFPDDKWDWKPEPKAKSAHEIFDHLLGNYAMFNGFFGGAKAASVPDVATAKTVIVQAADDFIKNLRAATPEQMSAEHDGPGMKVTPNLIAGLGVADILHHHGQIAYLQTLWGDDESHFDYSLFPVIS